MTLPELRHGVRVDRSPGARSPFPVDALVVEEDSWQVLGADPEWRPAAEHPIRLMRALREAEPLEPGTVVVHEDAPVRLHAVVHDLDREPTWREAWIAEALAEVLRICAERGYRALGLPLLGTRHGRLPDGLAERLIDDALVAARPRSLRRLWLIVDG